LVAFDRRGLAAVMPPSFGIVGREDGCSKGHQA
jgi:pyruvoyl-dependent arginine decarboxylase (PvlArgDC)